MLDAVVISGGEPTIRADLVQFAHKVKGLGLLVRLDTNGTSLIAIKELLNNNLVDSTTNHVSSFSRIELEEIKVSDNVDVKYR